MNTQDLKYLQMLSELYPTIAKASTEIINLQSIINLPKGTEHFITDVHGEYEAFSHVLKNGSGADRIMDTLLEYHSLDIQWGNHDIYGWVLQPDRWHALPR